MRGDIGETMSGLELYSLEKFNLETLKINSRALLKNPLKDSPIRFNPVMVPKSEAPKGGYKVVLMLSGLTGNGPKSFAPKTFEDNTPQAIDRCVSLAKGPTAIFVFVDAMTFWGGSQFINSRGCGRYEDYIMDELVPLIRKKYPVSKQAKDWCVTGASSGGYGALHLASKHPKTFGICAALAPDSFFSASLLPEIYTAAPVIKKVGVKVLAQELREGRLFRRKNAHTLLNAIAMAHCYSGDLDVNEKSFPIDFETGLRKEKTWKKWSQHDPVEFLSKRIAGVKKLNRIYLDVGRFDQFQLAFGARQMALFLKKKKAPVVFQEFDGDHFTMAPRREILWQWLEKEWKRA